MKKVLCMAAVAAMVMGGSVAMADSFTVGVAGNYQEQGQAIGGVDLGGMGGISGMTQDQAGFGASASSPMSVAAEGQIQGENTNITAGNGYGFHSYNSTAVTEGGSSTVGGGVGVHFEAQQVEGGIATVGNGVGTGSVSGSAVSVDQAVGAGGLGFAGGESAAFVDYNSSYEYNNTGVGAHITQTGAQEATFLTGAGGVNGGGLATLNAQQVGGTAAANDGNGTSMAGSGAAEGSVKTVNGVITQPGGTAGAGSLGYQTQTHSYTQASTNGYQSQWASGTVSTGNAVADGVTTP